MPKYPFDKYHCDICHQRMATHKTQPYSPLDIRICAHCLRDAPASLRKWFRKLPRR